MLWFHLLSFPFLHFNTTPAPTEIGRVFWSSSQYLDEFMISTTFPSLYQCIISRDTTDCYDTNRQHLIQFHLRDEIISFSPSSSLSLCLSQLHQGDFILTNSTDLYPNYCQTRILLSQQFSLDAHLFINWKKMPLYLPTLDVDFHEMICSGLTSSTTHSDPASSSTNFFPISLSEQYGNPMGFLYWLDRCGYSLESSRTDSPNFILVQLWDINDAMLIRSSSPESPSLIASCPCILRKVILWMTLNNSTVLDEHWRGNCLEEFLSALSSQSNSHLSMLSSLGWKELISMKHTNSSLIHQHQYLSSQELKQIIFAIQAFQSAHSSSFPSPPLLDKQLHITSLLRPLLLSFSDHRHGKREFLLFRSSMRSLYFSPNHEAWDLNLLKVKSHLQLFSDHYLLSQRNSLLSARLFHWLSELLFSCEDLRVEMGIINHISFTSPISLPSCHHQRGLKDPCPTFLLSVPDLFLLFLDLIQTLVENLHSSNLLLPPHLSTELQIIQSLLSSFQSTQRHGYKKTHFLHNNSGHDPSTVLTHAYMYNTMILCFVRMKDTPEAELFISGWRMSTPTAKHTYSYHIIPIGDDCLTSYQTSQEMSTLIPCHRTVFLTVEQFIEEFSSHQDRVVVLVGIEAIRSVVFSQNSTQWILPNIFVPEFAHTEEPSLLYSLIMGLSPLSLRQSEEERGEEVIISPIADLRVFMGFARDIRLMILDLRNSPVYTLTDDGPIIAFEQFCVQSYHRQTQPSLKFRSIDLHIHIDQRKEYFDLWRPYMGTSLTFVGPTKSAVIQEEVAHLLHLKNEIIQNGRASLEIIEVSLSPMSI
jgi:hypothetical protein